MSAVAEYVQELSPTRLKDYCTSDAFLQKVDDTLVHAAHVAVDVVDVMKTVSNQAKELTTHVADVLRPHVAASLKDRNMTNVYNAFKTVRSGMSEGMSAVKQRLNNVELGEMLNSAKYTLSNTKTALIKSVINSDMNMLGAVAAGAAGPAVAQTGVFALGFKASGTSA